MKIILLGAPGSGKGTVSEYIVNNHNFVHLSTGNLFRKKMEENNELSDELKSYILKGQLVPDELVNKVVKSEIISFNQDKSLIFDGYPRTIEQAEFLISLTKIDKVLFLDVPEDELEKRLIGRRMCSSCKRIYNIYFNPPKHENICDYDGASLFQRKDDDALVIKERLETYKMNTFPLVDYFDKKNILIRIDGKQAKDQVNKKIDNILKNNDSN